MSSSNEANIHGSFENILEPRLEQVGGDQIRFNLNEYNINIEVNPGGVCFVKNKAVFAPKVQNIL